MATIKNMPFGELLTVENPENTGYLIRLNFSVNLGNNFSYSHFVNSILDGMQQDNPQELLIEWCRSIDLDSDLIIIDSCSCELDTNVSDFNDHTRDYWVKYCGVTYP